MVDASRREQRRRELRENVAARVWYYRLLRDVSLREAAKECGIPHRTLWMLEGRETDPRLSTLFYVAEGLGVTVADLVSLEPAAIPEGAGNPAWLVSFDVPQEIADRVRDYIEQQIGAWLLAALTNREMIGWLATQIRLTLLREIIGPVDQSDPVRWQQRVFYDLTHPWGELRSSKWTPPWAASPQGNSKGSEGSDDTR